MIEKLNFGQGVLVGIGIGLKNLADKEFQGIKHNPYILPEQKMKLLKEKYMGGVIHDYKMVDDCLKCIAKINLKSPSK